MVAVDKRKREEKKSQKSFLRTWTSTEVIWVNTVVDD